MKRFAIILAAGLGICLSGGVARADWGTMCYSGYQPWWNVLAHHNNKCKTCEEKKLERFWHDYYDALRKYYKAQEHIDWVTYYKNHGYQLNAGCGGPACGANGAPCPRINYAPVVVTPTMQWAVPPSGPGCAPGGPMGCAGPAGY